MSGNREALQPANSYYLISQAQARNKMFAPESTKKGIVDRAAYMSWSELVPLATFAYFVERTMLLIAHTG